MIANYHTHTYRCRHANGTEREYVERAIEGGLKLLGFSDHTPNPFPQGFACHARMRLEEMDEYVKTVHALRDEYQNDIEIHLGLEVEYYADHFGKLLEFTRDYPVEYFLLAQHSLEDRPDVLKSKEGHTDPRSLERYCEIVIEAMRTGRFTYVAHPDLFHFPGDPALYDAPNRRLCRCAKELGIPLEINFMGIENHSHYPREQFWRIAGEEGCTAVFGSDAHSPAEVWRPELLERAQELVRRCGLCLADTVELKNPFLADQTKTDSDGSLFTRHDPVDHRRAIGGQSEHVFRHLSSR